MIYMYVIAFWRCHFVCHVVRILFALLATLLPHSGFWSVIEILSHIKKKYRICFYKIYDIQKNHLVWFLLCLYGDRNSGENNKWTYKFPFFQMHFWFQIAGSLQICTNMVVYHYMYQQLIILLLWSVIEFDLPTSNCTGK